MLGHEPEWTTWKYRQVPGEEKSQKKRCIDYIWYAPKTIRPKQVLALPKDSQMHQLLLPSLDYPSDHLSLMATFGTNAT